MTARKSELAARATKPKQLNPTRAKGRTPETLAAHVARKKSRYLQSMASHLDPVRACKFSHTDRTTVWRWQQEDPEFVERLNLLTEFATENVEGAVYRRSMKMSTGDARLWLQAHKRDLYGDHLNVNLKNDPKVVAMARAFVQVLREFVPREQFESSMQRFGVLTGMVSESVGGAENGKAETTSLIELTATETGASDDS